MAYFFMNGPGLMHKCIMIIFAIEWTGMFVMYEHLTRIFSMCGLCLNGMVPLFVCILVNICDATVFENTKTAVSNGCFFSCGHHT